MSKSEGFEIIEEELDFVMVDKETKLSNEYKRLLSNNASVSNGLVKMVHSLQKAEISGNNRDLWLAAANCVIKCMADVILEGEKLLVTATSS
jgi:hypothetical protein